MTTSLEGRGQGAPHVVGTSSGSRSPRTSSATPPTHPAARTSPCRCRGSRSLASSSSSNAIAMATTLAPARRASRVYRPRRSATSRSGDRAHARTRCECQPRAPYTRAGRGGVLCKPFILARRGPKRTPLSAVVVCFAIRQRFAGTRRVHQREHAGSRAGTSDTPRNADLQDKRDRG
jgi:hypothetical protein